MKKKVWIIFILAAAACLALGLSACAQTHTHTFAQTWSSDETGHWHEATCGDTEEKRDFASHLYENGACSECGYEHEDHEFTEYTNRTETQHTGTCSVCGKVVTENHTYENGVCEDCEYEHENHTFDYSNKTETQHTGTCSVCGKTVTENHTYENGVCEDCEYEHTAHRVTEYSEKTETQHTGTCSVCGKVVTENHTYEKGVCTTCGCAHEEHTYSDGNVCEICGASSLYTRKGGTKIYFGEYPQTEVTDANDSDKSLRNSLNMVAGVPSAGNAGKWTDYGYYIESVKTEYMWYIDVPYSGNRYRGVYFASYRPSDTTLTSSAENSYQDGNGYTINTVYWFKYEPIEWRILEEKNGTALLLANIILDSQQFYYDQYNTRTVNDKTIYPNNYAESNIRAWLNGTFFETAFDESAQEIIEISYVDNSVNTTTTDYNGLNNFVCENTQDKVFLLSYQEAMITSYGFSNDTARQLKSTDYAKSQGCWQATDSSYRGNGQWWLRSPYLNNSRVAVYINNAGRVYTLDKVNYTCVGVVPALWIRL